MIADLTLRTLHASLTGLDARRRSAEDNVANVQTPGFIAHRVDFEASLRDALAAGEPHAVEIEATATSDPTRMDGNNVRIGDELVGLTETALRQQTVIEAMNGKYRVLRTAIGGT